MQSASSAWQKVRKAMADSQLLRTVEGLSEETGLSKEEIKRLLEEHDKELRKAYVTDTGGRAQYTLKSRPMGTRELWSTIRAVVTGQP
jgi:hypothetical protein